MLDKKTFICTCHVTYTERYFTTIQITLHITGKEQASIVGFASTSSSSNLKGNP
jgi:hypothetical protein